jgi:hypothetical protein
MNLILLKLVLAASLVGAGDTLWVARPDGGRQCSMNSAQTPEEGAKELQKSSIEVFNKTKTREPGAQIALCGTETGAQNAYEIKKSDLAAAQKMGFKAISSPKK